MLPGCQVAEAVTDACGAVKFAGSPVVVEAAGAASGTPPLNSRRDTASADHSRGSAAGNPPPPDPSHESRLRFARIVPGDATTAAGGGAVITGAESTVSAICEGATGSEAVLSAGSSTAGSPVTDGVSPRGEIGSLVVSVGWVGTCSDPRRLGVGADGRSTGSSAPPRGSVDSFGIDVSPVPRRGTPGVGDEPS